MLVQFAWRPIPQEGTPPEAAVVTSAGGLLHGCLGGVLKDFLGTTTAAACCAWSADGSALAYAAEDIVTVQRVAPAAAFSLRAESQVHAFRAAVLSMFALIDTIGERGRACCTATAGGRELDADLSVDTLAWAGQQGVMISGTLRSREQPKEELVHLSAG